MFTKVKDKTEKVSIPLETNTNKHAKDANTPSAFQIVFDFSLVDLKTTLYCQGLSV